MSSILIRSLDPAIKDALAARAAEHGRSMESEAREILSRAVTRPRHKNIGVALRSIAEEAGYADDLVLPSRDDEARVADLE